MPFPEQCFEATVEYRASHLKEEMRTLERPAHRLALAHSLVDYVAHSRVEPVLAKVEILDGLTAGDQIVVSGTDAFNGAERVVLLSH